MFLFSADCTNNIDNIKSNLMLIMDELLNKAI